MCIRDSNCIEQVKEQIKRKPLPLPKLEMPEIKTLDELQNVSVDDFVLNNYQHHEALTAPMAI